MMRRNLAFGTIALALALPGSARAAIDASCPLTAATSAIPGTVQDALGSPVPGMRVELYRTNASAALPDAASTDGLGRYRVCAGASGGQAHDVYDVHVRDPRVAPLFASANQPYTTVGNLGSADFTPASGLPVRYLTNLTIEPAEISTATGPRPVRWIVRSKAPQSTRIELKLDHESGTRTLAAPTIEGGGPAGGGWNVWIHQHTFETGASEALSFATVRGFSGTTEITQSDRAPYVIDNARPLFGPAGATTDKCGPGVVANPFSPGAPGTTNPMPVVAHGVCDHWSSGARSGLDPFSLTGTMCTNPAMSTGCLPIDPVLNVVNVLWWPRAPLSPGNYYLRWSIRDLAGNTATSPVETLSIITRGGQLPVITAPQPGNMQGGGNFGVIVGSQVTSPSSFPYIGFRALDADGLRDIVPGSVRLRVFYGADNALVYDYDPAMASGAYDPVSKRGGGSFDLSVGTFRASGYPLSLKAPGRYVASASITDHGGNTATMTWQWLLVAAV